MSPALREDSLPLSHLGSLNIERNCKALCPTYTFPLKHATLRPISSSFGDCDSPQLNNHHQMVNTEIRLIIFFATKDEEALYSQQKTRPGTDCGSDHELTAKFRLKLKKVGKTTRPFRHNLYQIAYPYTVEVTNRFKGLNLIECLKNYRRRFMSLYRRQ